MKLWLTRDRYCGDGCWPTMVVIGNDSTPSMDDSGAYGNRGDKYLFELDDDIDVPPGTCVRLYTEEEVRAMMETRKD